MSICHCWFWDPGISKVQSLWARAGLEIYSFAHSPNFSVCIYLYIQCMSIYIYVCVYIYMRACFCLEAKNCKETISLNLKIAQTSVTTFHFLKRWGFGQLRVSDCLLWKCKADWKGLLFSDGTEAPAAFSSCLRRFWRNVSPQNFHKTATIDMSTKGDQKTCWVLSSVVTFKINWPGISKVYNEMMWVLGLVTCDKFVTDLVVATVSSTEDFGISWCSCQEREPMMVENLAALGISDILDQATALNRVSLISATIWCHSDFQENSWRVQKTSQMRPGVKRIKIARGECWEEHDISEVFSKENDFQGCCVVLCFFFFVSSSSTAKLTTHQFQRNNLRILIVFFWFLYFNPGCYQNPVSVDK